MGAVLLIASFAALSWWLSRTASRQPRFRRVGPVHGPVRLRDGVRASKAAAAAAAAETCVWCDELPCEAGPHWRWSTWVDHGSDR